MKSRFSALRPESSYRQNRNESAPNSHTRHQNSHTFHHTVRRPFADAAGVRHDDHRHHPPRGRPMTRASPSRIARRRGRPIGSSKAIERDPQRFEIACWWAFVGMGFGPFDAARRALLVTKSGPFSMADVEGVLVLASTTVGLPQPFDPLDPDKGLRRLSAKAKHADPSDWLVHSSALVRAVMTFISTDNMTGVATACDGLIRLGWGPTIMGLVERIATALKSNLPPADLDQLSPGVRRLLTGLRPEAKV